LKKINSKRENEVICTAEIDVQLDHVHIWYDHRVCHIDQCEFRGSKTEFELIFDGGPASILLSD